MIFLLIPSIHPPTYISEIGSCNIAHTSLLSSNDPPNLSLPNAGTTDACPI